MAIKKTRLRYIVVDKEDKEAYLVTDVGGISSIIDRSSNTIHNWFRNKKRFKSVGRFEIYKGINTVKSNRRNVRNLLNKFGK